MTDRWTSPPQPPPPTVSRASRAGTILPPPPVTRESLARMDGGGTTREHWKILLVTGMGFFTDAYDLFIIGIVASMIATEWHTASYQISLLAAGGQSPRRSPRASGS